MTSATAFRLSGLCLIACVVISASSSEATRAEASSSQSIELTAVQEPLTLHH